ncbi:MAG: signal peptide peptidase SppA [Oscillospiraceae bacterium]|nr:signal peptide peptidase SppA [Oscillospiraceae bacterium]
MKSKQVVGIVIAVLVFVIAGAAGVASASTLNSSLTTFSSLTRAADAEPASNLAVIDISGTIGASSSDGYDHEFILGYIEDLTNSYENMGILLHIDSPGGRVYETDEVYLALENYKNLTGRPVYAYAESYMASGAYYIACAADLIAANRNSWVGSIGVYISTVNYKGLFDTLGIRPEYIKSGENKAMGNGYDELTEEQYAIYQGLVDESFEQFLDIVCSSRTYSREEALPICDGRIYTAAQGLENGLIDRIYSYEEFETLCLEECGASNIYERVYVSDDWMSYFFGEVEALIPKSEAQILLEQLEQDESGVPMYYAG